MLPSTHGQLKASVPVVAMKMQGNKTAPLRSPPQTTNQIF